MLCGDEKSKWQMAVGSWQIDAGWVQPKNIFNKCGLKSALTSLDGNGGSHYQGRAKGEGVR
jgi:hypothetical protein